MANQPTGPAAHPPPEVPSMPDVSPTLTNYLRTFSLWCRRGFAAKVDANTAIPAVMLLANDAVQPPVGGQTSSVWMLTIRSNGQAIISPMPLGGGKP